MDSKKKKTLKQLILMFGVIFSLFIMLAIIGFRNSAKDIKYYQEVNLNLSGIINEVRPLNSYGHDFGVISIKIIKSNIKNYDERKNLDRYLGVIKNNRAELVFESISSVMQGDSIVLNIQNYKLYRNGKLIDENIIGMPPSSLIFTPFKEVKQKFKL